MATIATLMNPTICTRYYNNPFTFFNMLLLVPRFIPSTLLYYNCIYIHVIPCTYIQDTTNQEATICTPEQGHMDVMDNANNVANDDSDDDREFTDDEDCFVMMTHIITMSQKIAIKSAAMKVSFTRCVECLICLVIECAT
jgi:hypothetical protein